MKVFISWSGELSKKVAMFLHEWLPLVIQGVEPYLSSEDIAKGARWIADLSQELEQTECGIFCLTRENVNRPWILFEAGAISKRVVEGRVVTLLIDLPTADVIGPLAQFNHTLPSKEEIWKMVKDVNDFQAEGKAPETRLEKQFEAWWPKLEAHISEALKVVTTATTVATKRDPQEILEEVLDLTRTTAQTVSRIYDSAARQEARDSLLRIAKFSDQPRQRIRLKDFDLDLLNSTRDQSLQNFRKAVLAELHRLDDSASPSPSPSLSPEVEPEPGDNSANE